MQQESQLRPVPMRPAAGILSVPWEGLPPRSYHWGALIASLPANLLLELLLRMLQPTIHRAGDFDLKHLPQDCIFYAFHPEIFHALLTIDELAVRMNEETAPTAYLGYHGWASYFGSLPLMLRRMRAFRYEKRSNERPYAQIMRYLTNHAIRLFIRTDAGGPYRRVRSSLVRMARETGRPLVPFRQIASRKIVLLGHELALPGATITTLVGQPIFARELEGLTEKQAVDHLQKRVDGLGRQTATDM